MPQLRNTQLSALRPGSSRGAIGRGERSITEMNESLAVTLALQKTRASCAFCDWPGIEGTADECRAASIAHREDVHPAVEKARSVAEAKKLARKQKKPPVVEEAPAVVLDPVEPVVEAPLSGASQMLRVRADAVLAMPSDKRPRWTLADAKAVDELLGWVASQ